MRLLTIGAGGVGQSAAMIIKTAGQKGLWLEQMILADYDEERAREVVRLVDDSRFKAEKLDAGDKAAIIEMIQKYNCTFVLNVVAPSFNEIIFEAAYEAGVGYMDCAMTLSKRHPEKPYEVPYIKLGDYQFDQDEKWEKKALWR
ncbi:MAG: saccharopine dehydrogenase NADP-binding domain-containing protein [Lachnospiraceae bacterium]